MSSLQRAPIIILIFLALIFPVRLKAEEDSVKAASGPTELKPVEIHYTTLTGLSYSLNDEVLLSNKDFEALIFPLNDYEAIRLLKRSESSASTGGVFKIIGVTGLLVGVTGLLALPSDQHAPFWATAVGGGITFDIGGLFQSESQTAKFNSVQRYNRFARGEEQMLPRTPQDEKSLLNFKEPVQKNLPHVNHETSAPKLDR